MRSLILIFAVAIVVSCSNAQTVYYVSPGGNDANAGTSWAASFATLQKALSTASSGNQIWVAAGTYKPAASDVTVSFQLKNGVAIYGGFAGTESNLGDRNWQTNVTTLSGDLDGDETLNGNSHHVVYGISVNATAVLDGFVVSGGNASDGGGGVELLVASPTLSNLQISGNSAPTSGGGIESAFGSPILSNITFSGNHTGGNGGGMDNQSGNPSLTDCTFVGNTAANGGGFYNDASSVPVLTDIKFRNDTASSFGGGFYENGNALSPQNILFESNHATLGGGGLFESGSSTLANLTLYNNTAKYGGGIFITGSNSPNIVNTILWQNAATATASEVYNTSGGTVTISYSLLQGGIAGTGVGPDALTDGGSNIDADPLFVNPGSNDLTLTSSSPAINAGNTSAVSASTDLAGNARISDDTVDIGAYEFQGAPLPVELVSFTAAAKGTSVVLSWNTATEFMCYGFSLERRIVSFQLPASSVEQWTSVGFVRGHGTTASTNKYFFLDNGLSSGEFAYRMKQIDQDGKFKYTSELDVTIGTVPSSFSLDQNYPNPFNPSTKVEFTVPAEGRASLKVFNSLGQEIASLFDGIAKGGEYQQSVFDGTNFASGIYFLRLQYDGKQLIRKMLLMK